MNDVQTFLLIYFIIGVVLAFITLIINADSGEKFDNAAVMAVMVMFFYGIIIPVAIFAVVLYYFLKYTEIWYDKLKDGRKSKRNE